MKKIFLSLILIVMGMSLIAQDNPLQLYIYNAPEHAKEAAGKSNSLYVGSAFVQNYYHPNTELDANQKSIGTIIRDLSNGFSFTGKAYTNTNVYTSTINKLISNCSTSEHNVYTPKFAIDKNIGDIYFTNVDPVSASEIHFSGGDYQINWKKKIREFNPSKDDFSYFNISKKSVNGQTYYELTIIDKSRRVLTTKSSTVELVSLSDNVVCDGMKIMFKGIISDYINGKYPMYGAIKLVNRKTKAVRKIRFEMSFPNVIRLGDKSGYSRALAICRIESQYPLCLVIPLNTMETGVKPYICQLPLKIDASGCNGKNGRNGASGMNGTKAYSITTKNGTVNYPATAGTPGGNGGDGEDGGSGGDIICFATDDVVPQLMITVSGGKGGAGGKGGRGGMHGWGGYASSGYDGRDGSDGRDGGKVIIPTPYAFFTQLNGVYIPEGMDRSHLNEATSFKSANISNSVKTPTSKIVAAAKQNSAPTQPEATAASIVGVSKTASLKSNQPSRKIVNRKKIYPSETKLQSDLSPVGFSIGDGKQVYFAPGNLQYNRPLKKWRFAQLQNRYEGAETAKLEEKYQDWVDLFDYTTLTNKSYSQILNNPATTATWRVLTSEEWEYLMRKRPNAYLKFGLATVDSIHGIVILPDRWTKPQECSFTPSIMKGVAPSKEGLSFIGTGQHYNDNTYTSAQWRLMEKAGAIFLPASGGYNAENNEYKDAETHAYYWTTTTNNNRQGRLFYFFKDRAASLWKSQEGKYAIRLVRDVPKEQIYVSSKIETPNPSGRCEISVSTTKKVLFAPGNLRYQPSTDRWSFATQQYAVIGKDNEKMKKDYNGWIDLFCWGSADQPIKANYKTKKFVDWGKHPIIGQENKPNEWRTPTKDEWLYAAKDRANAAHLLTYAIINGIKGVILLPDTWVPSSDNTRLVINPDATSPYFKDNILNSGQWEILAASGAIFLPMGHQRYGKKVVEKTGSEYWTSSYIIEKSPNAYTFWILNYSTFSAGYAKRAEGHFVRLVKDVK